MKHPDQAALALHAGGDLGAWASWKTARHLAKCEQCREEFAAFQGLREVTAELAELPTPHWDRLAAEMTANIRLGVAAGECVKPLQIEPEQPRVSSWRAAVAMASITAIVAAGLVLELPKLNVPDAAAANDAVRTEPDGIGNRHWKLMYRGANDVMVSASAQGSVQARYTDPETGYVTVSQVDAQ
jgi:hypothetical protein